MVAVAVLRRRSPGFGTNVGLHINIHTLSTIQYPSDTVDYGLDSEEDFILYLSPYKIKRLKMS